MKKMLFIMNPFAGQKRANRQLSDLLMMFTKAGYDLITHMTTGTGSAVQAVERLAGEVELIVCCGGDGTFNECVCGAAGLPAAQCAAPPGLRTSTRPKTDPACCPDRLPRGHAGDILALSCNTAEIPGSERCQGRGPPA